MAMLLDEEIETPRPVAVIPMGAESEDKALQISNQLRRAGFKVEQSYSGNMKKRMAKAVKANAFKAVIIGSDELAKGEAAIKDLDSGEQKNVKLEHLIEEIK